MNENENGTGGEPKIGGGSKVAGILILVFVLAAVGIVVYKFLLPRIMEKEQRATSDARTEVDTIRIAGDNYLGYWFISSPEMRKQASRAGVQIQFTDDGGAYAERLQKFNNKQYDCIVLPVNSYLEHGERYKYPGVIIASISESKGADGIVGYADRVPTGKVNDLNDSSLLFVLTGASPSEFLVDLTIASFGLEQLGRDAMGQRPWIRAVASSKEVYETAKRNEGDIFVLWEPDLSKALELPGMKYIFGSDQFAGYIVDVMVFHRDFVKKKPQFIQKFLRTYYRVMSYYGNQRDLMIKDMSKVSGLKKSVVEKMLDKIDWHSLAENFSMQFGIAQNVGAQAREGLVDTIIACTDVMIQTGRIQTDPLRGDPYKIINSEFMDELSKTTSAIGITTGGTVTFTPMTDWSRLREIGTMRVEPITFQTGNDMLDYNGKQAVDKIAQMLTHNFPDKRIEIRGHTGPGPNEQQNIELSQRRANAVQQYLKAVYSIDVNRLRAVGVGASQPLQRLPGESQRALRYRMARVEFILYEANPL